MQEIESSVKDVEQVVALLDTYPVSEISIEHDGRKISVRRACKPRSTPEVAPLEAETPTKAAHVEAKQVVDADSEEDSGEMLTAQMVGIFYHMKQPLRYGGVVQPGQVVGSIESMKLMNDVPADSGGVVVEVLIEDGSPVEYGQPLFRLSPR